MLDMRSSWLPLIITLAIQAMVAMALITLPVMATETAQSLGVTPSLIGVYVAIVYVGAMVASLAAGAAVKRWGAIRVSQLGLLLCAMGLALCAAPSLWAIGAGAFLIGCGYGPITPASSHLLARTTAPHQIALVFSIKQTGVPLGGVLAGALVPSLAMWNGWQVSLLWVAALNLLCLAIAQTLRSRLDSDRSDEHPLALGNLLEPIRLVLRYPVLRLLAACSFVFSMVQLSFTTYLVTYLHLSLGYALVAAGAVLSLAQVGGMVGRVFWGWVADRWIGARNALAVLAVLMASCALLTASWLPSLSAWWVLVVLVIFGASAIGWNGVYLAEVARQSPPGLASVATGGTLAITFLGVVLGPPLFGLIAEVFSSYRVAFALLALPTVFCFRSLLPQRAEFKSEI